jgi:short-subunit dehydrogenase
MKQLAVITGASSGIGRELAVMCARGGFDLHLVARRKDELAVVKKEIESAYGSVITTQALDLSKTGSAKKVFEAVHKQRKDVEILINNAGFGDFGDLKDQDVERLESMIDLNVTTLTKLTRMFLPHMVSDYSGKILNVASIAGMLPGPGFAVYHATKAYVLSFSEALAEELADTGVTVTALCPGPTETGFKAEAHMENVSAMSGKLPTAKDVAQYGYFAMMDGKRVAVPGIANKINALVLPRIMPRAFMARVMRNHIYK